MIVGHKLNQLYIWSHQLISDLYLTLFEGPIWGTDFHY